MMKNGSNMTRRSFMRQSAAAVIAAGALTSGRAAGRVIGANDRIGVGVIGVGHRGTSHLRMLKQMNKEGDAVDIRAVCDIYRPRLDKAAEKYGGTAYSDYHDLLADPAVDVVCIATPEHLHGQQVIDAFAAGKDVYCEKPITHWRQFELTKQLAAAAKATDRVFQLGTQAMSDSVWRQMKQLVREGLIGQPVYGETGYFRIGDFGERGMPVEDPNIKPGKDLNWEAFLGDTPNREFTVDRYFRWRLFEDFAGGPVTDLFPHSLTQVVDIMGMGMPSEVTGMGGIMRYDYELREVPDTFNLIAQYSEKAVITVMGTQANDHNTTLYRGAGARCPVIRGWDGALTIDKNKDILFTPIREKGAKLPQRIPIEKGEDNVEHWRNLISCCRNRDKATWSPAELAFRTQTVLQMAMLSHRSGKVACFDSEKQEIIFS